MTIVLGPVLSLVIVGDAPGSKLARAEQLGVRIVDAAAFAKMIGS